MIIRDFECEQCNSIHEEIVDVEDEFHVCLECGGISHKIITNGHVYMGNENSDWIKSVLEVVDKESDAPHTREFLKHPNRSNYKAWMKGEGIRPFDAGEKPRKPEIPSDAHMVDALMKAKQKRHRLEIR